MHKPTAIALATLFVTLAASPALAGDINPSRERVRQWELRQMARYLSKEEADRMAVTPKIVGGTLAPAGAWPFQVAILNRKIANNFFAQFCGGTLVDELFVVTAAHCVHGESAKTIDVLTGTQSLASGGTRQHIVKVKAHPNYNDNTTDYDIAVIQLTTPVKGIKTATMINGSQEKRLASAGTDSYVTGWGDLRFNAGDYQAELREVMVPIVSTTDCNDNNSYDGDITDRMICAGFTAGGKDSCSGDSGGPLVVKDGTGKWRLLAGIVSWGNGCAKKNFFGVYSRVAVLGSWANKIIASWSADIHSAEQDNSCEGLHGHAQATCLDRASLLPD